MAARKSFLTYSKWAAIFLIAAPCGAIDRLWATTWLPIVTVGGPLTTTEKRKEDRQRARDSRDFEKQFRKDVAKGKIDSATGLAELLIPPIRYWRSPHSFAWISDQDINDRIAAGFSGSALDGIAGSALRDTVSPGFARGDLNDYGFQCNKEFRSKFVTAIESSIDRKYLDKSFITLSFYQMRFDLPYYNDYFNTLENHNIQVKLELVRRVLNDPKNPLPKAVEAFLVADAPRLTEPSAACPIAYHRFLVARDAEIERLRKRNDLTKIREMAKSHSNEP